MEKLELYHTFLETNSASMTELRNQQHNDLKQYEKSKREYIEEHKHLQLRQSIQEWTK